MPCLRDLARAVIVAGAATAVMFAPAAVNRSRRWCWPTLPVSPATADRMATAVAAGAEVVPVGMAAAAGTRLRAVSAAGCFNGICGGWDGSRGWGG